MQIWFARIDPKTHRMVVERPPHARVDVILETRSLLVHDFAHWAVETALVTDKERAHDMTGADTLRRLDGAWRKARQGEAITVTWPEPAPRVVALTV